MSVSVILLKEIPQLGKRGEVKSVSDGFARNFLFPRGLAEPATESKIKELKSSAAAVSAGDERDKKRSEGIAAKLAGLVLKFNLTAGAKGQAFGSISATNVMERLSERGIKIEPQWINLPHHIKTAGEHTVDIRLPQNVDSGVTIRVTITRRA